MNNSKLAIDSVPLTEEKRFDRTPILAEQEGRIIKIIEALAEVRESSGWSTLKIEVFDGLTATLERQLREEAKQDTPDALKLNRLAGQLKWAEKFSDLEKLEQAFRVELTNIRKNLHGKPE